MADQLIPSYGLAPGEKYFIAVGHNSVSQWSIAQVRVQDFEGWSIAMNYVRGFISLGGGKRYIAILSNSVRHYYQELSEYQLPLNKAE